MKLEDVWTCLAVAIVGGLLTGYCVRAYLERRRRFAAPRAFEKEVDDILAELREYQEALVQVAWCEMRVAQRLRSKPPGREWDNTLLRCVEVGQQFAHTARLELEERGIAPATAFSRSPEEAPESPLDAFSPEADPFPLAERKRLAAGQEGLPARVGRWEQRSRKH